MNKDGLVSASPGVSSPPNIARVSTVGQSIVFEKPSEIQSAGEEVADHDEVYMEDFEVEGADRSIVEETPVESKEETSEGRLEAWEPPQTPKNQATALPVIAQSPLRSPYVQKKGTSDLIRDSVHHTGLAALFKVKEMSRITSFLSKQLHRTEGERDTLRQQVQILKKELTDAGNVSKLKETKQGLKLQLVEAKEREADALRACQDLRLQLKERPAPEEVESLRKREYSLSQAVSELQNAAKKDQDTIEALQQKVLLLEGELENLKETHSVEMVETTERLNIDVNESQELHFRSEKEKEALVGEVEKLRKDFDAEVERLTREWEERWDAASQKLESDHVNALERQKEELVAIAEQNEADLLCELGENETKLLRRMEAMKESHNLDLDKQEVEINEKWAMELSDIREAFEEAIMTKNQILETSQKENTEIIEGHVQTIEGLKEEISSLKIDIAHMEGVMERKPEVVTITQLECMLNNMQSSIAGHLRHSLESEVEEKEQIYSLENKLTQVQIQLSRFSDTFMQLVSSVKGSDDRTNTPQVPSSTRTPDRPPTAEHSVEYTTSADIIATVPDRCVTPERNTFRESNDEYELLGVAGDSTPVLQPTVSAVVCAPNTIERRVLVGVVQKIVISMARQAKRYAFERWADVVTRKQTVVYDSKKEGAVLCEDMECQTEETGPQSTMWEDRYKRLLVDLESSRKRLSDVEAMPQKQAELIKYAESLRRNFDEAEKAWLSERKKLDLNLEQALEDSHANARKAFRWAKEAEVWKSKARALASPATRRSNWSDELSDANKSGFIPPPSFDGNETEFEEYQEDSTRMSLASFSVLTPRAHSP